MNVCVLVRHTNTVNLVVLEERAHHSVTDHRARNTECKQLHGRQARSLMVRRALREECPLQLARLVQMRDHA